MSRLISLLASCREFTNLTLRITTENNHQIRKHIYTVPRGNQPPRPPPVPPRTSPSDVWRHQGREEMASLRWSLRRSHRLTRAGPPAHIQSDQRPETGPPSRAVKNIKSALGSAFDAAQCSVRSVHKHAASRVSLWTMNRLGLGYSVVGWRGWGRGDTRWVHECGTGRIRGCEWQGLRHRRAGLVRLEHLPKVAADLERRARRGRRGERRGQWAVVRGCRAGARCSVVLRRPGRAEDVHV